MAEPVPGSERNDKVSDIFVGDTISSVAFVQDYMQLDFNGNWITFNVWPVIRSAGGELDEKHINYKNALCDLINIPVEKLYWDKSRFALQFVNGVLLDGDISEEARILPVPPGYILEAIFIDVQYPDKAMYVS